MSETRQAWGQRDRLAVELLPVVGRWLGIEPGKRTEMRVEDIALKCYQMADAFAVARLADQAEACRSVTCACAGFVAEDEPVAAEGEAHV